MSDKDRKSDNQAEQRRDELLKRLLKTPPQPRPKKGAKEDDEGEKDKD